MMNKKPRQSTNRNAARVSCTWKQRNASAVRQTHGGLFKSRTKTIYLKPYNLIKYMPRVAKSSRVKSRLLRGFFASFFSAASSASKPEPAALWVFAFDSEAMTQIWVCSENGRADAKK